MTENTYLNRKNYSELNIRKCNLQKEIEDMLHSFLMQYVHEYGKQYMIFDYMHESTPVGYLQTEDAYENEYKKVRLAAIDFEFDKSIGAYCITNYKCVDENNKIYDVEDDIFDTFDILNFILEYI